LGVPTKETVTNLYDASWIKKLRRTDMVDMEAMCSIGPLH
jgi:hypothetical protein